MPLRRGIPDESCAAVLGFVVASCGLAYELIAGALASYLLGDSVTSSPPSSAPICFAMGSARNDALRAARPRRALVQIELLVGVVGGFSAAALFFAFVWFSAPFKLMLYLVVFAIGVLVGLEIPLIMRILSAIWPSRIWCRRC